MPGALTEALTLNEHRCPRCGAVLRAGARQCWLCHAAVVTGEKTDATPPPQLPSVRARPERLGGFSLASLMTFVTLVAVILGVSTINDGVGIPLGVMLLVAWWRTAAVSRHRSAVGKSLIRSEQIHMYVSSFGLAIALIVTVTVSICVAFGAIGFGFITVVGGMGTRPNDLIGPFVVSVVSCSAALGLIWLAVKWDRYSWRRDVGENEETRRNREVR